MTRVVVIGAGLAGLTAALRLAEGGARVTVVATGSGSLPLSPGTIDVMGYDESGRVDAPGAAVAALAHSGHPYAQLSQVLDEALGWFRERVPALRYVGGTDTNMLLPTAVGAPRPTALAPASMAAADLRRGPRLVVVGLRVLKDFFPSLLADNLGRAAGLPAAVEVRHAEVPVSPHPGRADVAPQVFARALDDEPGFRHALADGLLGVAAAGETLALPAVLGLKHHAEVHDELQQRLGVPVAEIATIPPSVPGLRLDRALRAAVDAAGGRVVVGTSAVAGEDAGGALTGVVVEEAARRRTLPADAVVLATGGFSAGGLQLDSHGGLREAVLGLPVDGPPEGERGLSNRHLDHQPLMAAGVRTGADGRVVDGDGSVVWGNLWAAGTIVAGAHPWREKSGEGIAIAGGYRAATGILEAT
ncbi:MAG: glycerol-3-phosphate dehydrogenase subunit GlpB [Thermoleophilia bacterium]